MKFSVYEIINEQVNIPVYVGMSSNVKDRINKHDRKGVKGTSDYIRLNKVYYRVICDFNTKKEALKCEEAITDFYTKTIGLNLLNIKSASRITNEIKVKISNSQKGKKISEESRKKNSQIRKIDCAEGTKERERLLMYNEPRKIKIKDHQGVIYESLRDCERLTGCFRVSIKKVLDGKFSQTNGFRFFYV